MSTILKGGRLKATRPDVVNFISSLNADKRIALSTVLVNEAHVLALVKCRAVKKPAARKILTALRALEKREFANRRAEDVHVLIEESVLRRAGQEVGGLLHTGKSRNDQVVTAVRMTLRNETLKLADELLALQFSLIGLARNHVTSVFPGYTHLQPAQPISFGHYAIANCFSFIRDNERLLETYARVNQSPMGAAALAGTSFPLDRAMVARLLGFDGTVEASLDSVGGRDFALEALAVFALISADISRVSADMLFYSSAEVGLVSIPDEFASTSSIMPQKKNLDPLELVRAKCAKVASNFNSAVTLMHGLTSGYNLDYQEVTPLLWQSVDELESCIEILKAVLHKVKPTEGIAARSHLQFTTATEIANLLVRIKSMPFRTAHQRVGSLVRTAIAKGKSLREMQKADWENALGIKLNQKTFRMIARTQDLARHIYCYQSAGSPNPRETKRLIGLAAHKCKALAKDQAHKKAKLEANGRLLRKMIVAPVQGHS